MNNPPKDQSIKSIVPMKPSTFETVDFALYDFINDKLNLYCTTPQGWTKAPVIWSGQERAKQAKDNPDIRDLNDALVFPIIAIERGTPIKNIESKGKFYGYRPRVGDFKGGSILIATRIKQDKTIDFSDAATFRKLGGDNEVGPGKITFRYKNPNARNKVVYEVASIPAPVYYQSDYKIKIKTEYQQQLNELVQPFLARPGTIGRVMINRDGYRYEAFIQPDTNEKTIADDMTEKPRYFESQITIKVYGYLIGGGPNEPQPFIVTRETLVNVAFLSEHVMLGDIPVQGQPTPGVTSIAAKYKP